MTRRPPSHGSPGGDAARTDDPGPARAEQVVAGGVAPGTVQVPGALVDRDVGRLETAVSAVLRVGVMTSCLLIAIGAIDTLVSTSATRARRTVASLRHGHVHPVVLPALTTVSSVVRGSVHGQGPALVTLGILLLVATPVVRVATSLVCFSIARDRRFVLVTAGVLAVLLASFALG